MVRIAGSVLFLFFLCSPLYATSLDLFFNDTSAQVGFRSPIAQDDYGRSEFNTRFLYNDDEETALGSVGFDFVGEPGNVPGLDLGVGTKIYGGHTEPSQDLLSLGVGGSVHYSPPALGGFGASALFFYAPSIFSVLDSERIVEGALRLTYAITPRVRLGVEYQRIRSKFEDAGTWTIDEGIRAGFVATF